MRETIKLGIIGLPVESLDPAAAPLAGTLCFYVLSAAIDPSPIFSYLRRKDPELCRYN